MNNLLYLHFKINSNHLSLTYKKEKEINDTFPTICHSQGINQN